MLDTCTKIVLVNTREKRVWGHWRSFLVVQVQHSYNYLHRFAMEHERSSETKKILQCPQTLSLFRVGSGNETRLLLGGHKNVTRLSQSCHKVVIR